MGGAYQAGYVKAVISEFAKQFPDWRWQQDIDSLSIHMYPTREVQDPASAGQGGVYRRELIEVYEKPVWNTETGTWDSGFFHTDNAPVANWGRNLFSFKDGEQFTDASQASVESLAANFLESTGNGLRKYFYYDMRVVATPAYYTTHPSMLEYDDTIRPKGIAYAVLAKLFDHAVGTGRVRIADEASQAFVYDRGGTALLGIFTADNARRSITLPGISAQALRAYDSMGNRIRVSGRRLVYGRRAVYLEAEGVSPEQLRSALRAGTVRTVADTAPPSVSIDEGPRGALPVASVSLRWSGGDDTATPGVVEPKAITYSQRLTGPAQARRWSAWDAGNTVSYSELAAGRYAFEVKGRDRAGNVSDAVSRRFEIAP